MPVILTTAPGLRRSGHVYDDRTGVAYEFPAGRYERWIRQGERFIYCEPKRGYFGSGVLGSVAASSTSGRRIAEIAEFVPFAGYVGLRDSDGAYYEADPDIWKGAVYWAQGVRPLSLVSFERILAAAPGSQEASRGAPAQDGAGGMEAYARSETAMAVERYSVGVVLAALRRELPLEPVTLMPHNNPGFDIRVGAVTAPKIFVEVKGTQSAEPTFFLSAGEREFSYVNASQYALHVLTGIDLKAGSHAAHLVRHGAVTDIVAELKPSQWRGRLLPLPAEDAHTPVEAS